MEQRKKQHQGWAVTGDNNRYPAHSIRKPAKKYKPEQARQSAGAKDQFRSGVFHALWTGKEEQRSIHGRIPDDSEPCGQTEERHKQPTLISWISKTFFQWIGRSFARFLQDRKSTRLNSSL